LASICFGIALYGDSLRTSGGWGPLEAFSLLVMFVGAIFLSHSPLVMGMKADEKTADYNELLAPRMTRRAKLPGAEVSESNVPFSHT
ncbi:MAG TPA: hypothetical protein VL961_10785, partial [Acidimicrobiales bacterium]|nr:hypothetical protein [Acidimicrobiales bacterium]